MSADLSGRTALVTGCRRGIGKAIAGRLAAAGADVVGVSSRLEPDGGAVGEAVRQAGRRFTALPCDLGDRAALHDLVGRLDAEGHRIDILVNNAGIIRRSPAESHADADWDAVMAVNATAGFLLTRELGRRMLDRGRGHVVFVASVLSFQGGINVPGYAASKGATAQLVRAFANEWAGRGVHVNGIAPGYVETDNTAALRDDPERTRALLARVPAGRWATPDEIAGPVLFLVSDDASFVHGEILTVDGGWMAR